MILDRLFARNTRERRNREVVAALYDALMGQARKPGFYTGLGVADTVSGRFDMVVLHAYLVVARLRNEGEAGKALAQALFDYMFVEMDSALREMGVGDLSVGKRIQKMASIFYGRAGAYEAALASSGDEALKDVIARNLYPDEAPGDDVLARFAAYLRDASSGLAAEPAEDLFAGKVAFPPVPAPEEVA